MNPYLLISIETGPELIDRLFRRIPRDAWDRRLDPDRFTAREIIAHLADWEPEFRGRMLTAKSQPGAPVEVYDEGEWAIEHGYADKDPQSEMKSYRAGRKDTADFLRALDMSDFDLYVVHPEGGK